MNKQIFIENIIFSLLISGIIAGILTIPFHLEYQQSRDEFKQTNHIDENNLNKTTECCLNLFDGFYAQRHQKLTGLFFTSAFVGMMMIYPIKKNKQTLWC